MTILQANGTQLEVDERGDGEALVLIHGSASDARTWSQQHDVLAQHFRTVVYSRRHHRPNPPIAEGADYSLRQHVDDLDELISALDLAPAHLVGHSYGAIIGLNLALRAPHRVRSLVLGEAPVFPLFVSVPPRPAELLRLLVRRPRTALAIAHFGARGASPAAAALRRGDLDAALARFGTAVLGPRAFRSLSAERRDQARANFIAAEVLRPDFGSLDAAALRTLDVPTLLLGGANSRRLFRRFNDRLAELLPRAERDTIPGAGHDIHEDAPTLYNDAVLSFLARLDRPVAAQPGARADAAPGGGVS